MIVMITSIGDVWLERSEATAVAKAMRDNVSSFAIHGCIYTTRSVQGLLTPETYKTMYVSKKRSWTCRNGSAHAYNDSCYCRTQQKIDINQKQIENNIPQTPEQKLRTEAMREWLRYNIGNWKAACNETNRKQFIDNYLNSYPQV